MVYHLLRYPVFGGLLLILMTNKLCAINEICLGNISSKKYVLFQKKSRKFSKEPKM